MMNTVSEAMIRQYLNDRHIAHADRGYRYLVSGIRILTAEAAEAKAFVVSSLYERIAEEYDTKPSCVERDIRTSIRKGFKRDEHPNLSSTNKEFLAQACDELVYGQ